MDIIRTKKEMHAQMKAARAQGKSIALVPTMGALHEGHLTLVRQAVASCDVTVVSLFVNPRQFNNPDDLKSYPRKPEEDAKLLEREGVNYLYMPIVEDIYDDTEGERKFDFGMLDKVMEGTHRPGHFEGVAQVVSRLFDIAIPHKAFFGEKDFQQLAIIKKMVKDYSFPLEIVPVPIVRAESGLALSSRNQLLSAEELRIAPYIHATLIESDKHRQEKKLKTPSEAVNFVINKLNAQPPLRVEYFEIVDSATLKQIDNWEESQYPIGCIACYCGEVRLIDNHKYYQE